MIYIINQTNKQALIYNGGQQLSYNNTQKIPILKYLYLLCYGPAYNHQSWCLHLSKMERKLTHKMVSIDIEHNGFVAWDSNILRSFSLPRESPILLFVILFLVLVLTSQSQLGLQSSWNHKGLRRQLGEGFPMRFSNFMLEIMSTIFNLEFPKLVECQN